MFLATSTVIFYFISVAPGDPVMFYLGGAGTEFLDPERVEMLRHEMDLDKPIWMRYFLWLGKVLRLDLGYSFLTHDSVFDIVSRRLGATILLMLTASLLAMIIGIPLGTISGVKQYSITDKLARISALFGISIPVFWFGLMAILVFSLMLGWFPTHGMYTLGAVYHSPIEAFIDGLKHLTMPALIIATRPLSQIIRMTRSCMLDVLRQDYITTARSKGLKERVVIYKHALRNALLPVVTLIGANIATMFSGAVITETIFAWPGLGRLLVHSTLARDYPVLMGASILMMMMVLVSNLITDVSYSFLDPRVKY